MSDKSICKICGTKTSRFFSSSEGLAIMWQDQLLDYTSQEQLLLHIEEDWICSKKCLIKYIEQNIKENA